MLKLADVPQGRKNLKRENSPDPTLTDEFRTQPWLLPESHQDPSTAIHGQPSELVCSVLCHHSEAQGPPGHNHPGPLLPSPTERVTSSHLEWQPGRSTRQRPCSTIHGPSIKARSLLSLPRAPERQCVSPGFLLSYSSSALPTALAASLCPFCRIWLLCFVL